MLVRVRALQQHKRAQSKPRVAPDDPRDFFLRDHLGFHAANCFRGGSIKLKNKLPLSLDILLG